MQTILTLEEKKKIVRKVMESHQNIPLTEVKNNNTIKTELRANLAFYNEVKKGFLTEGKQSLNEVEGIVGVILSSIGNIKDFITGAGFGKNILEGIKKILTKVAEYVKAFVNSIVPGTYETAEYIVKTVKNGVKWIYKTLTWPGLAKLFAMIRYRTLKPTKEQKACMELAAKKAYRWILIVFIGAFIVKIIIGLTPAIIQGLTTTGGLTMAFSPLITALQGAGLKTIAAKLYSAISAALKAKDYNKLGDEVQAIEKEAKEGELDDFSEAWNKCPLPVKQPDRPYGSEFDEFGNPGTSITGE
jgi:flagellar biosynthesis protein FliQ